MAELQPQQFVLGGPELLPGARSAPRLEAATPGLEPSQPVGVQGMDE